MIARHWKVALILFAGALLPGSQAAPVPEIVRWDWYFRESLRAVRDWETILDAWAKSTPEAARTPILPVPANGEVVEYPLALPRLLVPPPDRDLRVRVRLDQGKLRVEWPPTARAESFAPDQTVTAYHHPGGGGKDRWYHSYQRRFDQMLTFRAAPAPFALRLPTALDLRRGRNDLELSVRNTVQRPLTLQLSLRLLTPAGNDGPVAESELTVPVDAEASVRLPLELRARGGGLALLTISAEGQSYWLPWLTDVEDTPAVLESVRQALADGATPDPQAEQRLAQLQARVSAWNGESADAGPAWRAWFEEASAWRDGLLLRQLDFSALLFVKREAFDSEQPYMDAHHLLNRPGGAIYRLSPVRPDGAVTPVVDTLGEGIYRDLCLHWDADRFLFAFGNGSDNWDGSQSYHIYEAWVDGGGLRQLTSGPKNDCEPVYLPNGQLGFTSDRSEHFVMCGGPRHASNLFVMGQDGSGLRQLSFNVYNDFNPSVLPDGRLIYSRWEYNERSVTSLHHPFTLRPDGTMMAPYYGNATIRPNVVMFPRAVPGSRKVMALFTAHHGQTHGPIGLIDVGRGVDGPEPLTVLTPNVPITGEKALDSQYGWYSDPMPLSETTYLCSFTPTVVPWVERSWALYVGDQHGNLALVYRDPTISCAEPVPVVARPRPHVLPPAGEKSDAADGEATLVVVDVTRGLTGVPRDAPRFLRIVEDLPREGVHPGGVILTSGTSIYTVKRIWGTVPLEADGSAHFTVPANRNVYFEVLDGDQREIQRMRSVVCLKPREVRGCVGCHEPRTTAPPNGPTRAFLRAPSRPVPPPWGTQIVSFLRDVQPVLNARCVQCHTHDRFGSQVILTDDLTDRFCVAYEELLPYLKVANAMRWDNPEDVYGRPPYTYGSKVSPLMQVLEKGHHDVRLTEEETQRLVNWIDANGVYYDRYESAYGDQRSIFSGPAAKAIREVCQRRCATCHGESDGRYGTWWLSLNRRDVKLSRALQAPLARAAGGWGSCEQAVFASADDPDYGALLGALTALRDQLAKRPREDLLSLAGTPAETQRVELPPPPARRSTQADLPPGDWVSLVRLQWESGKAGWTPNQDGLPRRNVDVEGNPLMLGGRRYATGIGTHAPSEIVYRLDGRYARFSALVGGAESGGTVVFQVWGGDQDDRNDKCLFESGVMRGLQGAKQVDVPVAGVQRLRLIVTDAGDGYTADMANWAVPRLLRGPG